MEKSIEHLTSSILEKFPAGKEVHTLSDLSALNLPAFLMKQISNQLFLNFSKSLPFPQSEWADLNTENIYASWELFKNSAKSLLLLPAENSEKVIRSSVSVCLSLILRPYRSIPSLLSDDSQRITQELLLQRSSRITLNSYLAWGLLRYMEKKEIEKMDRTDAEQIVRKIDEKLMRGYHPLNWLSLVKPLYEMFDEDPDHTLIQLFFEERACFSYAREFEAFGKKVGERAFVEILSSPSLIQVEGYGEPQKSLFEQIEPQPPAEEPKNERQYESFYETAQTRSDSSHPPVDYDEETTSVVEQYQQSRDEEENEPVESQPADPLHDALEKEKDPSPSRGAGESDSVKSDPMQSGADQLIAEETSEKILDEEEKGAFDEHESEPEEGHETFRQEEEDPGLNRSVESDGVKSDPIEDSTERVTAQVTVEDSLDTLDEDEAPDEEMSDAEKEESDTDKVGTLADTFDAIEAVESDQLDESSEVEIQRVDNEPWITEEEIGEETAPWEDSDDTEQFMDSDSESDTQKEEEILLNRFMFDDSSRESDDSWFESGAEGTTIYDELQLTVGGNEPDIPDLFSSQKVEDPEKPSQDPESENSKEFVSTADGEIPEDEAAADPDSENSDDLPMWQSFLGRDEPEREPPFLLDVEDKKYPDPDEKEPETDEYGYITEPIFDLTREEPEPSELIGDLSGWMSDASEQFIDELFGGSEEAYEEALVKILEFDEWKQATRYIEREVFSRNRVDIYDETAVDFTDRLHTFFIENRS